MDKVNKNQIERTTNAGFKEKFPSQPVIAIVRNHLDSTYMGNLEVEILTASNSGQSTNAPGQILPVRYLTPFHGVTSLEGTSKMKAQPTVSVVMVGGVYRQILDQKF